MPSTATIVMAVISAIGTYVQYQGMKKSQKAASRRASQAAAERRRAESLQRRRDDIVAARQRRRAVSEQTRLRARAVNLGAIRGVGGAIGAMGSTIPGATGSLISQLNANNAFINQVTSLNAGIRSAQTSAVNIAAQPISAGSGLTAFGGFLGSVARPAGRAIGKYIDSRPPAGGQGSWPSWA